MHLKLKYHNLHGEAITVNVGLEGAKRIYKALRRDQRDGKNVEINIVSLSSQLKRMDIYTQKVDKQMENKHGE